MKPFSLMLFLFILLAKTAVFAQTDNLEDLFRNFRHFDLRDALAQRKNDNSTEVLFYRGAVANRFNETKRSAELLQKYFKKANKNATHLADAYEILADNFTKEFQYGKAADAYKFLLDNFRGKIDEQRIKGYENMFGLWNSLRQISPQTVEFNGDSNIQGTRDSAKLLNVAVEIGSVKDNFVFDTGAGLSTISLSTAQKFGLKIIEADVSVGSSTEINVKSKLAVAPEMKIGNAKVRNAIFLVLEDKALSFPQINYQIHGIVGFPVIHSLGKVSIDKNNQVAILAKSEKTKAEPNLAFQGLTPIIAGFHQNKRLYFVFDTGAASSDFYPAFFKSNEAEISKNQTSQKVKIGGAGGFKEVNAYRFPEIELNIGGKTAKLTNARILTEQTNENSRFYYGNLGQDLIKQFDKLILDFRNMQISFE
ncbi:MAG: retropepsin-like domain-containing protein [Pyrinomonadaceae bacterium]|nr:retropepsin-like domain-containing protein [Pyrinomonadaceae bacterium]